MTERGRRVVVRDATRLAIGPSTMSWRDDGLEVEFDEVAVPWPRRTTGSLRLYADGTPGPACALDQEGRHVWQALAPRARVEVELAMPRLSWSGHAYADCNRGSEPLERAFRGWHWSRSALPGGDTVVIYEVDALAGARPPISLRFGADGRVEPFEAPPAVSLPRSRWGLERRTRADAGQPADVVDTLEDTPFYARSLLRSSLGGAVAASVHESLSLERFSRPWVQAMLPFRMPRRG